MQSFHDMPITRQVDQLVTSYATPKNFMTNRARRIHLTPEKYIQFLREIEPFYKAKWGSFLTDKKAADEGWENVIYKGMAVCCGKKWL